MPNATAKSVPHNISNLRMVIEMNGIAYVSSEHNSKPLPLVYQQSQIRSNVGINCNATNIEIETDADRRVFDFSYITLKYIKTS